MNESKTPRTDEAQIKFGGTVTDTSLNKIYADCLNFARQLETELNGTALICCQQQHTISDLSDERDRLKKELNEEKKAYNDCAELLEDRTIEMQQWKQRAEKAEAALTTWQQMAERLASVAESHCCSGIQCSATHSEGCSVGKVLSDFNAMKEKGKTK
jgi:DNA repair exonuclease SbcCD ATPase subunit